jgi:hypothetical protein
LCRRIGRWQWCDLIGNGPVVLSKIQQMPAAIGVDLAIGGPGELSGALAVEFAAAIYGENGHAQRL